MSINPQDFAPTVYRDKNGREYRKMPGQPRKVPREIRAQIYQLDLTVRESKAEIRRLIMECGVSSKSSWIAVVARIRRERGA